MRTSKLTSSFLAAVMTVSAPQILSAQNDKISFVADTANPGEKIDLFDRGALNAAIYYVSDKADSIRAYESDFKNAHGREPSSAEKTQHFGTNVDVELDRTATEVNKKIIRTLQTMPWNPGEISLVLDQLLVTANILGMHGKNAKALENSKPFNAMLEKAGLPRGAYKKLREENNKALGSSFRDESSFQDWQSYSRGPLLGSGPAPK